MDAATPDVRTATAEERLAAARALLDAYVAEVEPLSRELNEAHWKSSLTGAQAHVDESARLELALRSIHARREPFARLSALAEAGVPDPEVQRQLDLAVLAHRPHQIAPEAIRAMVEIEKRLEQAFSAFRAELDGREVTNNEIHDVLRASDDPALRQRAWEASKQIGGRVAADLVALVRLRNEAARAQGYPNYYAMMLTLDELDETELFALLEDLDRATRPAFETYKRNLDAHLARRFSTTPEALRPWHLEDPFFQEAPVADVDLDPWFASLPIPEVTAKFFAAIGIDIEDLLARADLYEKPGKDQHAFCMSVDRGDDIRVLCNVKPNERWMGTMLHEFGHAAYDKYIDAALPFIVRTPAHTLTTEATAMLFGRLSKNAAWLERYAGMDADAARATEAAASRAVRQQLLVQTRWCLVMCHMERALYRDPDADLDTLWWDLVERFQLVHRPDGRHAPDWASKIHFSLAPVYYHNYMLGEMMASQLQQHIQEHVLGGGKDVWARYVSSPEVGAYLRDRLFRYGRSLDWRQAMERSTGRRLGAAAFAEELAEV